MKRLGALLAATLLAAPLSAHDFWIEPSNFHPAVGSTVAVRLFVGPHFEGEAFPRVPSLVSKFVLVSASGEQPIPGASGDEPAGTIRVTEAGLALVGYRSLDYPVSLDAAKFEEYLKEEGLEKISAQRAKRGETGKPAREVFSRCAKALLDVGGAGAGARAAGGAFDRPLGFTLELLPEKNPYALRPGDSLPVRLLYGGKPLAGALVHALRHGEASAAAAARTGPDGSAALRLSKAGFWMIKAVEMGPAPAGSDADWQSLWASLTFEIGPANPVGRAP